MCVCGFEADTLICSSSHSPPPSSLLTSLTGKGKLDGVASDATECVHNEVAAAPLSDVLCYFLWSGTEPPLCRSGRGEVDLV